MPRFHRGHAEFRGIVDAPVEDVWELLTDWEGIRRWWIRPQDGGRPGPDIASIELSGERNAVPRTRIVHHATGSVVSETLFLQDDETRRIYFDVVMRKVVEASGQRGAFKNRIDTIAVDLLSTGQTLMTFKAEFDLPEDKDVDLLRALFEASYSEGVLKGFQRYFARQR